MTEEELKGLLESSVTDIVDVLGDLSPADITALQDLEAAGKNRSTLLSAIDDYIAAQTGDNEQQPLGDIEDESVGGGNPDADPDAAQEPAGKAVRGEEEPDWQKPDYSGPLTIPQAEWRNTNIQQKAVGDK